MGLNYPVDLEAWHAWQQRQNTLRWVKGHAQNMVRARRGAQQNMVSGMLYTRGAIPRVLIVLDSFSPTSRNALLEPLKHLEGVGSRSGARATLQNISTDNTPAHAIAAKTGPQPRYAPMSSPKNYPACASCCP